MTTKSITCTVGEARIKSSIVLCPRGEVFTVRVALVTAAGSPVDLSGESIVLGWDTDAGTVPKPQPLRASGGVSGIVEFNVATIDLTEAAYAFDIWREDELRARTLLVERSVARMIDPVCNLNQPPVVTIASPADGASVVPGTTTIVFSCTDQDGTLTASSFSALVNGQVVDAQITLTSGSGTGTVSGTVSVSLTTVGARTIAVRCTDASADTGIDTHSITVTQPIVTITAPASGSTIDDGQVLVTATTSPAMPGSTVLRVYERVGQTSTLVGTGTLSVGALTSSLAVGAHVLYASVSTVVGTVSSADTTVTAEARAPSIVITAPTNGQTLQFGSTTTLTAEVTHASGATAIQSVQGHIGNGATVTLNRVGETNVYTATGVGVGTSEGSIAVVVSATDRSPTTAENATPVTVNVTRDTAWSDTVSFAAAADGAQTATAGAVTINFDVASAVNGRTWRLRLPTGAASVLCDIVSGGSSVFASVAATAQAPTGWQFIWDSGVATSWGQTAQGFVPWTPGVSYTVLARVNTATQRIHLSAEVTQDLTLSGWDYRWALNGSLACTNPVTGAAIVSTDAVHIVTSGSAPTFASDPGDATVATRGQCLSTTTDQHCTHLPVTRGSGDWTVAAWISAKDDPGNLSYGPLGPNLSDGGCDNLWRNPTDGAGVHCLVVGETRVAARVTELWGDTMAGRWYHLVYSYRSSDNHFLVWVNGRLVLDQVWDRAPINGDVTSGFTIGGQNTRADNGARGANCYVREALVRRSVPSTADVQAAMRVTAPTAVATPDICYEFLGSSTSDEMSTYLDAVVGESYTVRGGNVGGSRCSDSWTAGINTYATQWPQAVQRIARGARTLSHCDQGLVVNAGFVGSEAAVRARFWADIERIARCGALPVTSLMAGHTDSTGAFAIREDTLENATLGWRAHALSVMFSDWIGALGLTTTANYVEPVGSTGEAGPHLTATGRTLVAARMRDEIVLATGVAA